MSICAYNKYVRKKLVKEDNTFDDKLRKRILKKYDAIPEVLDSKAVSKLTGYSVNAVNRCMQKGKLRSVITPNGRITSKEWIVESICNHDQQVLSHKKQFVKTTK